MSPVVLTVLLVALSLISGSQQQSSQTPTNDTQVLISFLRRSFGIAVEPQLDTGLQWNDRQELIKIDLSNRRLSGKLTSDWCNLSSLEILDLSSNNVSGTLEIEESLWGASRLRHLNLSNNPLLGGPIPRSISRLVQLEVLDLSRNSFSEFPAVSLPSLKELNVSRNKIQGDAARLIVSQQLERLDASGTAVVGEIPTSLVQLQSLKVLDLSWNSIAGGIPDEFGQLYNMTRLDLSGNHLSGEIPDSLGNCTQLSHFDIMSNQFTGGVPSTFGDLPKLTSLSAGYNNLSVLDFGSTGFHSLESLYLRNNFFQGPLTASVGRLANLKFLVLQENSFSGPIPPELGNCSKLEEIWFQDNSFDGPIPEELFKLSKLRYLSLDRNKLSGEIPDQFGKLPMLDVVWLQQNEFTGTLPQSLGKLPQLLLMVVSQNQLTGTIPASFVNLRNLIRIDLGANNFSGQLPELLLNLSSLEFVLLSNNSFSGSIPEWIGEMKNLRALNMSHNNFTGSIPARLSRPKAWTSNTSEPGVVHTSEGREYTGFAFPTTIDLSHNILDGSIPKELGSLENLQVLDLSNNKLSGNIPSELGGSNKSFLRMDLSNNQLTGEIPGSFEKLTFLQFLDVSNNHLRGRIPETQLSTFPNTSYAGNDGLCGIPLTATCSVVVEESPRTVLEPSSGRGQFGYMAKVVLGALSGALVLTGACTLSLAKWKWKDKPAAVLELKKDHLRLNAAEFYSLTENFHRDRLIGTGGTCTVYLGILPSGQQVAVKKLSTDLESTKRSFIRELQTLGKLRHRNLMRILGCFMDQKVMALILKHMPNGSLEDVLHFEGGSNLNWESRYQIALGVAQGLHYLHHDYGTPVVHCDLKPSNILLDEDFHARIADFGISRILLPCLSQASQSVMWTVGYTAPEVVQGMIFSPKADVYSFGIVLMELLTRMRPSYVEETLPSLLHCAVQREQLVGILDRELQLEAPFHREMVEVAKLALECTRQSPAERPEMSFVLKWLANLRPRKMVNPLLPLYEGDKNRGNSFEQ